MTRMHNNLLIDRNHIFYYQHNKGAGDADIKVPPDFEKVFLTRSKEYLIFGHSGVLLLLLYSKFYRCPNCLGHIKDTKITRVRLE